MGTFVKIPPGKVANCGDPSTNHRSRAFAPEAVKDGMKLTRSSAQATLTTSEDDVPADWPEGLASKQRVGPKKTTWTGCLGNQAQDSERILRAPFQTNTETTFGWFLSLRR